MRPQPINNARTTHDILIEFGAMDEDKKLDLRASAFRIMLLGVTVGLCVLVNWLGS